MLKNKATVYAVYAILNKQSVPRHCLFLHLGSFKIRHKLASSPGSPSPRSFDFSRIKFARAKKVRKGEGEPGDEAA